MSGPLDLLYDPPTLHRVTHPESGRTALRRAVSSGQAALQMASRWSLPGAYRVQGFNPPSQDSFLVIPGVGSGPDQWLAAPAKVFPPAK